MTLQILRRPEFLVYLAAAICALISFNLLETPLQWVVLTSSGSTALVGALYLAIFIPIVILAVPVGLAIDRYGAKALLLTSQSLLCCLMLVGATLNHFGLMRWQVVIVLAALDGVCNATWIIPAQVLLGRVVRKELMSSAIGLGQLQYAAGRMIGGSLAAAMLSVAGPTAALALGAATAGIGLAIALRLRENRSLERRSMAPPWPGEVAQAFRWMIHNGPTVALLVLGALTALFTIGYVTVLPTVSRTILHAGPGGLGLMTAVGGVGVAFAAFLTEPLGRRFGRGTVICLSVVGTGIALGAVGLSTSLVLSVVLVGAIVGFLGVCGATTNSLLQALTPLDLRGRVLSIYSLVVWVIFPLATLGIGVSVDKFGPSLVLEAMGALTVVSVLLLVLSYRTMGNLDIGPSGVAQLRSPVTPFPATVQRTA